ncbi:hypothetical protein SAMN02745134_00233 [Clostridium acidisoli DSM 12555]|uniref:Uncharacterized protein n=1 Tax=Clostridium acidisoli DSM 12555 TaxID=1121291 RepID=A0A1W1WZE9_9CLOT|nr:hypothetical protein [Clostridium acidisoli]SMC17089.1 hypothetical protein SAMN02745134_00233 [Clostridium acidisoli DSM 12555]
MIKNYNEFERRLIKGLMKLGLKIKEIIITSVKYIDFEKFGQYGWWDFGQSSPMELAIKDEKRFKFQSEAKIIINTDNIRIRKILENPIKIAPLKDIVSVCNNYFDEGMLIKIHAEIKKAN